MAAPAPGVGPDGSVRGRGGGGAPVETTLHSVFSTLAGSDHAVPMKVFLNFVRPLLTNWLSLDQAFSIVVNAAATAAVDSLAAMSKHASDPTPSLSFDGFVVALSRFAQRRYNGSPDAITMLLRVVHASAVESDGAAGLDVVAVSSLQSSKFLEQYLSASTVTAVSEVLDKVRALFTDDVGADVEAATGKSLASTLRQAGANAQFGQGIAGVSWGAVSHSAAVVHERVASVRAAVLGTVDDEEALRCWKDVRAGMPHVDLAVDEGIPDSMLPLRLGTGETVSFTSPPDVFADSVGAGTEPGALERSLGADAEVQASPYALNFPQYVEWLARIAHRRSEIAVDRLVSERTEVLRKRAVMTRVGDSSALSRFRPPGGSDDEGAADEAAARAQADAEAAAAAAAEAEAAAAEAEADAESNSEDDSTVHKPKRLYTILDHFLALVAEMPTPVSMEARAAEVARATASVWHPSLSMQPVFGLGAPAVAPRVQRIAPALPRSGPAPRERAVSPPHGSAGGRGLLGGSFGLGGTMGGATSTAYGAGVDDTITAGDLDGIGGRVAVTPPMHRTPWRPPSGRASSRAASTGTRSRPQSAHSLRRSDSGITGDGGDPGSPNAARRLGNLAASLRATPTPFAELGVGIGPQPMRVIDPATIVGAKKKGKGKGKGDKKGAKAKPKGKAGGGKSGKGKGKGKGKGDEGGSRLTPGESLFSAEQEMLRDVHRARTHAPAVVLSAAAAKLEKEPPKETAPCGLQPDRSRFAGLSGVSPMLTGAGGGKRPEVGAGDARLLVEYHRRRPGPGLTPAIGVASSLSPNKRATGRRQVPPAPKEASAGAREGATAAAAAPTAPAVSPRGFGAGDDSGGGAAGAQRAGRTVAWANPEAAAQEVSLASPLRSMGTPFWYNDGDKPPPRPGDPEGGGADDLGFGAGDAGDGAGGGGGGFGGAASPVEPDAVAARGERELLTSVLSRSESSRALGLPPSAALTTGGPEALLRDVADLGAGTHLVPKGRPEGPGHVAPEHVPSLICETGAPNPGVGMAQPPAAVQVTLTSARAYHDAGNYEDALITFDEAREEWAAVSRGGELHPESRAFLALSVGFVLQSAGDESSALASFLEAQQGCADAYGDDLGTDLGTKTGALSAATQSALGTVCWRYFRFEMAARCFGNALKLRQRQLGPDHADTLASRHNLGCCLLMCGQGPDALLALRTCVSKFRERLTMAHPRSVTASRNLARALKHTSNCHFRGRPLELALRPDKARLLTDASYTFVVGPTPGGGGKKKKKKGKKKKK